MLVISGRRFSASGFGQRSVPQFPLAAPLGAHSENATMPSPKKEAPPPDSKAEKKARNLAAERSQKVIYKNPVFEQTFDFTVNCRATHDNARPH